MTAGNCIQHKQKFAPAYLCLLLLVFTTASLPAQIISTLAGNGTTGYSGNGGPATNAQLNFPLGIAADNTGNIWIADQSNNVIRKVDAAGIISTIAGTAVGGYTGDGGPATAATLFRPGNLTIDNNGNLYMDDQNGTVIRRISPAGIITTITGNLPAGYSGDGGPLVLAQFRGIRGLSADNNGNLYISDFGNHVIRKVNTAGIISTIAGTGSAGYSGDGGPATGAAMNEPYGVVTLDNGDILIPDSRNHRIRRVNTAGIISTWAGTGVAGYTGDGGPASLATFNFPWQITRDPAGNIFVAGIINPVIRKIDPSGIITTFAGNGTAGYSGDGGPAVLAQMTLVGGLCTNPAGTELYAVNRVVSNVVRKITYCQAPLIVQQPVNSSLCNTGNSIFSIVATGTVASYQWQVNTGTGWSAITDNALYAGTGTNTLQLTGVVPGMNNYQYRCIVSTTCSQVTSTAATLFVSTPVTPLVTITSNANPVCAGTPVTFFATGSNGGTVPSWQWIKNGTNVGSNDPVYTDNNIQPGDIVTCVLTSNAACLSTATATSNPLSIIVNPVLTASVTIFPSAITICEGTPVTFGTSALNAGTAPQYTWFKNNTNLFINSPVYVDNSLRDGDVIVCVLRSDLECLVSPVVISPPITITVTNRLTPSVTITASSLAVCRNNPVTFTTSTQNAGSTPQFQWLKNGNPVGMNSDTYTELNPADGDIISCLLIASGNCLSITQVSSNAITLRLYPDPVPQLDPSPTICAGAERILDPGNFASYNWSNGAVSRTISVNSPGQYSVTVTDNNGCTATTSLTISDVLPAPVNFLPADTSLCNFGEITLRPLATFSTYTWNTGSVLQAISITNPGDYWLQVTDNNGCTGRDSIRVLRRECLKGLFVPAAFTPGNDGRNDLLKPVLQGDFISYKFWIYNRWGQQVFYSADISKGWDGRLNGREQDTGIFIWVCQYQFLGEAMQTGKGSVLLIR